MKALILKEIKAFFNGLPGYIAILAFLIIMGLFLWVFPAQYNIPEAGYATLDSLFLLAPFVFLFLVPAITMRFFADEKRMGTLEMLMTKPLSRTEVVMAKYLAGLVLVVFSLLPTLVYVISIRIFSVPTGPDMGAIWGSYLGLLFLGMVYVSIGLFASALTENQIVAFIIALFLSGFLYVGPEMLHSLEALGSFDHFVRQLGLFTHYSSMGRGVVDSRDLLYFFGVIVFFLSLTHLFTGTGTRASRAWPRMLIILMLIVVVNTLGSLRFARLDLTSDRRYSLTGATKELLRGLDDAVYIRVYLDGSLPAEFRSLRKDTREMLDEFRAHSEHIHYTFVNPSREVGDDPAELQEYYRMLMGKGLEPTQIQVRAGDGTSQRLVFPGALITHGEREMAVDLLQDHLGLSVRQMLHNSSLALEYTLASAIKRISTEEPARIAFIGDKGGYQEPELVSAMESLRDFYQVDRIRIGKKPGELAGYRSLIVARPREAFTEQEKFLLDQYLMQGGRMLWLVDPVFADMDSLAAHHETIGMAWDINMDDFFFRYGLRLNPVLLKDLNAAPHPFTTGMLAGRPQINVLPWFFFPVLSPVSDHEIVRNLNVIRTEFISSIDLLEVEGVESHILLESSDYTRIMQVPVRISLDVLQYGPDESLYTGPPQAVAVLLEGEFPSLYRNRLVPPGLNLPDDFTRRDHSLPAAMIVMADGSVIRNQFGSDGRPLPLGYDRVSGHQFGNLDFILNAVDYLSDDSGIMEARARDVRLRLLDAQRLRQHRLGLQLLNMLAPIVLLLSFGSIRLFLRKRKYTR